MKGSGGRVGRLGYIHALLVVTPLSRTIDFSSHFLWSKFLYLEKYAVNVIFDGLSVN